MTAIEPGRPFRYGILSAANIARAFTDGCKPSRAVAVDVVASRTQDKAEAFAKELGIPRALGSYEALLADRTIDAVYIPLPNSMHAEWAIKACEAGKHVLCEKPLAMTAAEAQAIFDAARKNGVVLREAYPYMAQPQTTTLRQWLADGAIGRLRLIRSTFGVMFTDPTNIRLSPTLGGGALYDAGSYAVSLVRLAAGRRPQRAQATSFNDHNGVDLTTVANVEFSDGLVAQVSCTFQAAYYRHASISGEAGVIETNYLNHPPTGGPSQLQIRRGVPATQKLEPAPVPEGNGFQLEAESFARLVRANGTGSWDGASPEESIDIAQILDAIRASARTGQWVEVAR